MAEPFDGGAVYAAIQAMPQGGGRISALADAIRQADNAGADGWRIRLRYDYAREAALQGSALDAMQMATECGWLFGAQPDALAGFPDISAAEMRLTICKIEVEPIASLPQIPAAGWEKQMEQFRTLADAYHMGLREYWLQMCRFWQYVDPEKAFIYFRKAWRASRDALSEPQARERSLGVRMCLLIGDRAAADAYAKPMEAGRLLFDRYTPHLYWLAYLEDALNHGELERAKAYADKLYRKSDRDWGDLSDLGAVIRCWAQTGGLEPAVALAAKRLEWALETWDRKKQYDYYKGAWVCFRELAKGEGSVELVLPKLFPLFRPDGIYAPQELAGWFYQQAAEIGAAFDRRNGSDFFKKDLALA